MTQPLVTVITPTYNYAQFLPETIESVLSQDYPNIEYIVLDDGSTDNTQAVLAGYHDPRLTWQTHTNMGESRTVNKGFEMGKGDYFFIVNADDPIYHGLISTAVDFMEKHPQMLVAYPRWQEIDVKGDVLFEFTTYEYDYVDMVRSFHCLPGVGAIIRRTAIDLAGGRNPNLRWSSDIDLWLRIGLHGPMARIPQVLAAHRVHPASKTQAEKGIAMMQEYIRVVDDYFAREDIPAEVLAVKNQAYSNIYNMAATYIAQYDWALARKYFLISLRYCPFCRLPQPDNRATRSWLHTLRVILLPRAVNKFIKRAWLLVKPGKP